jgi:phosphate transport system substrate-binding protein
LAQTTTVWHLPYAAEVVGLYHSLEGLGEVPLNLTSCLIAKIFKRNITSWKDAALIKENPFLQDLPDESSPITVVHRDRSSAITQAYTEVSATWLVSDTNPVS